MLQTLKTFNQQRKLECELRSEIAETEEKLRLLNKRACDLYDNQVAETTVLAEALDAAGMVGYEIQPWAYGQKRRAYTITRIVEIEGFPMRAELDRATGILLLDGKAAQTLNPVLP